jgi:hypothetical protein
VVRGEGFDVVIVAKDGDSPRADFKIESGALA